MAFRVSPGVSIKEVDLTTIVPAVATTPGGFAGYFHWGPVNEIVTVTQATELANIFNKPSNANYVDFFTPANFLSYGNNCQVVRVVGAAARNANASNANAAISTLKIDNEISFGASAGLTANAGTVAFAAKYPGLLGNSLKVVVTNGAGTTGATLTTAATLGATFLNMFVGSSGEVKYFSKGDQIVFADGTTVTLSGVRVIRSGTTAAPGYSVAGSTWGDFFGLTSGYNAAAANVPATSGLSAHHFILDLATMLPKDQATAAAFTIKSVYAGMVSTGATTTNYAADAGGTGDLINVLVLDKEGKWSGTQNTLLEKFEGLSRATDARKFDGSSNYYRTVVNEQSNYVWALTQDINDNTGGVSTKQNWTLLGSPISPASAVGERVSAIQLSGGVDAAPTDSERWSNGWSLFADADTVDVSLLPLGNASPTLATLIIQNICEKRLDCMAFASPEQTDVENKLPYEALNEIKSFRDSAFNVNTSYAVLDSGWKYQLDTYNNLVRVMPLNADIAGLVARTEFTNEAWFSPAGFNRGQIKGVVKLAYNPTSEAHRDELYTRQVNPVVSFPGEGVILFGDKTMQTRPSAFDRINVRRLFIVLEKAIATASKFFLFEQNDAFTRAQFKNLVVPFLKTVQQRRGITDFKVVCDETNNTGEVIDRNEFVADIFVKPTRSVNFIQLNFIATRTGVDFSEVGG
jgi:phage tail sheath protein FI